MGGFSAISDEPLRKSRLYGCRDVVRWRVRLTSSGRVMTSLPRGGDDGLCLGTLGKCKDSTGGGRIGHEPADVAPWIAPLVQRACDPESLLSADPGPAVALLIAHQPCQAALHLGLRAGRRRLTQHQSHQPGRITVAIWIIPLALAGPRHQR